MNVSYLTDTKGNKIAVQVPFKQWAALMEDYKKLKQYNKMQSVLERSLHEVAEIEKGNTAPTTLNDFLNDC